MSGLLSVGYFLLSMAFGLATFVLWLRIGLQYFRVSTLHPISQAVYRITEPLMKPLSTLLHIRHTRNQRYEWVSIGILVGLVLIKYLIYSRLFFGTTGFNGWLIAIYTTADLIIEPCNILFYALVIRVIMSWVNPHWQHPLGTILFMITEPLLQRARRHLPKAGFDFSPFVVMMLLKIITLFVSASLPFPLL